MCFVVKAKRFFYVGFINISQVFSESFFDSPEGLADVLFATHFARDAVNYIRATAADVAHRSVF